MCRYVCTVCLAAGSDSGRRNCGATTNETETRNMKQNKIIIIREERGNKKNGIMIS